MVKQYKRRKQTTGWKKEEVKKEMNEQERTGQGVRLGGNRRGVRQPREDDKGGKERKRSRKERMRKRTKQDVREDGVVQR